MTLEKTYTSVAQSCGSLEIWPFPISNSERTPASKQLLDAAPKRLKEVSRSIDLDNFEDALL